MFRWLFTIFIVFFVMLFLGRFWYDNLISEADYNKSVHQDDSQIKTGINSQIRPQVQLTYQNQAGELVQVLADPESYSEFVQQNVKLLENAKKNLITQANNELEHSLDLIFDSAHERVGKFSDWYFAYTTTYKILWKAVSSTAEHTFSFSQKDLSDAVSHDIEQYILKHYEDIVLRPELTHPKLKRAYQNTLISTRTRYVDVLAVVNANFLTFVTNKTSHIKEKNTQVDMKLDWHSQFNKVNISAYEKTPEGKTLGAILIAGGASIGGKLFGGVAVKTVTGAASKGLLSKLASPFVAKAVVVGGSSAVGTLGGPIGTVIGAGIGLGIDYTINEGVEVMQKEDFIHDVNEAISSTQTEWKIIMNQSLNKDIEIWINDAIQLLPNYEKN